MLRSGLLPAASGVERRKGMKTQYIHTERNSDRNQTQTADKAKPDQQLERVAEELDGLAKRFLPDGVMQRRYRGLEADMRQDAILLALKWYLRDRMQAGSGQETTWNAPKSIGAALQIVRRDFAKAQKRESKGLEGLPTDYSRTPHHPSMDKASDWTSMQMEQMLRLAIRKLLDEGKITQANAVVTLALLVDGLRAVDIAKCLGVHRSAITHHFGRVRRLLPDVLDGIEVPRFDIFD